MAEIQLVETSLRDGNQCLWGALGVDTARTLTIAPVMDQVGFKAIDFTTSTHMGVAVRYKQEDPWERIRLMAEAMPNTPLQFLSTGFRFISWETASPEFMALAYRTLVKHGIRRFALADPMNDVAGNLDGARMAKHGGADMSWRAGLYDQPDPRRCALCRARAAAGGQPRCRCALHQRPGRAADAQARAHADPGDHGRDRRQAAGNPCPLHHRAWPSCPISMRRNLASAPCNARRARRRTAPPTRRRCAWSPICARWAIRSTSTTRRWARSIAISTGSPKPRICRWAIRRPSTQPISTINLPGGMVGTMRRHLAEHRVLASRRQGDRGAGPGARGAGLADRDDALRADGA